MVDSLSVHDASSRDNGQRRAFKRQDSDQHVQQGSWNDDELNSFEESGKGEELREVVGKRELGKCGCETLREEEVELPHQLLEDEIQGQDEKRHCKDDDPNSREDEKHERQSLQFSPVLNSTAYDETQQGSPLTSKDYDSDTVQFSLQTPRSNLNEKLSIPDIENPSQAPASNLETIPVPLGEESLPVPSELSNSKLALVLGSMWVGVFITALDSTIVATLLLPISVSFHALNSLAWLGSAYLIGQSAAQPLCGRLTDIFGRRAGLIVANVTFGIGTLICGLSRDQGVLIFGRVVAGLGGGAIYAVSTFVGSDLAPNRKRALITGVNNIVYGAGTGLGGLYGGWVNDSLGWRKAFLIQVPFIFVALVLVVWVVRVPRRHVEKPKLKRVDFLGIATLIAALTLFLLGLSAGGNLVAWGSPLVLASLPASGVFLVLFVLVEARFAAEPIIPLHLVRNRTVLAASLTYCFDHMAAYGVLFYIPIYLQIQGYTSAQSGLRFLPNSAGQAVGALVTGIIIRATGFYYRLSIVVHIFTLVGSGLLIKLSFDTSSWYPFVILAITGLGFGGMLVVNLTAIIAAVPREEQALATSASFVFRSCGSVLGLALSSAVFQNRLRKELWDKLGAINDAGMVIGKIRRSFEEIQQVSLDIKPEVLDSYVVALRMVFVAMFVTTVCAAVASLFMREHVLHTDIARMRDDRRRD